MTHTEHVTITLTEREARALRIVLSNSANHGDVMEALFADRTERSIAYRAVGKVNATAINKRAVGYDQ